MSYLLFEPTQSLRPLVQSIWSASMDASEHASPGLIAPDAHVEFVFHLGAPCQLQRTTSVAWEDQPQAMLFAQRHACVRLRSPRRESMVAFRTSAVVASELLGRSMEDLWDQPIALRDLIGSEADTLLDRLHSVSAQQQFVVIEQWILRRLSRWNGDHERQERLHRHLVWRSNGEPVSRLAARLGMSMRSLRRWIGRSTGLSPKHLEVSGRVLRSCALLHERPDLTLTSISHRLGFSDHAAFANVFREYAGLTPSAFRDEPLVFFERGPD